MILRYCLSTLFIASLEQQIIFSASVLNPDMDPDPYQGRQKNDQEKQKTVAKGFACSLDVLGVGKIPTILTKKDQQH
jgi:hypothetical protein